MIKGCVRNQTGRYKHIYKRTFGPGQEIDISDLYDMYGSKYGGELDLGFLRWIEDNKLPNGFNLVVDEYDEEVVSVVEEEIENKNVMEESFQPAEKISSRPRRVIPNKLTSDEIANLKIKDDPKKVISQVSSIHKLRRALTACKGQKGKQTLMKYIRYRIDELK